MPASNPHPKTISTATRFNTALWVVQGLLAITFAGTGVWKLATPLPTLAAMIPWAGQVSPALLYATAAFDLLGGVGILAPSVTRIKPALAVVAALGCAALQVAAIVFHFLALFVAWGRRTT
jgi:hypothetical protein